VTATAIPDLERVGSTRQQGGALAYLIEAWVLGVAAVRLGLLVAAHQAVRPHHLGRLELHLDLAATGSGSLDGGHGRLEALARPRHLLRPWWVGLLGLGQQPRRPGCRVVRLLLLDQDAEQHREVVTVHPTFLDRSSADFAMSTRPPIPDGGPLVGLAHAAPALFRAAGGAPPAHGPQASLLARCWQRRSATGRP